MLSGKHLSSLFKPFIGWFRRWAAKRRPRGAEIELNHKRVFIFPTATGWLFLSVCTVLFLIGTNYQNNLVHAISFLLISLGVLTIHYTFLNLSGLIIKGLSGQSCHVGDLAIFSLQLKANNMRRYESIRLSWKDNPDFEVVYLGDEREHLVKIGVIASERGRFSPPALKVETIYPLGLLRAWSWIELELETTIFPKLIKGRLPSSIESDVDIGRGSNNRGDDFSGFSEYVSGSSLRHIAWKHYAKGRGLLTKDYVGQESQRLWLSWNDWPELSAEMRLSVMAFWAIELEYQAQAYGLVLPEITLVPDSGPLHLDSVLTSLAYFDIHKVH